MNRRECALFSLIDILQGHTLQQAVSRFELSAQDEAWVIALLEGACRYYFAIKTALLTVFLHKPLPDKDQDIECLFILALYELAYMRSKAYAAVNEWVSLADRLKKSSYKGLINAVCRRYEREKESFDFASYNNGPSWLLKKYRKHYPDFIEQITQAERELPPLFLRVNTSKISVTQFHEALKNAEITSSIEPHLAACIRLHQARFIPDLPGYQEGWFYVQDASAQWAAPLLNCKPSHTVLDVCAAPGGKTLHLLECEPSLHITATDSSASRITLLQENLARFHTQVHIIEQDMTQPQQHFSPETFDRILLDAPCSGTGIIRRHPEIKLTRHTVEIQTLCDTQKKLLQAVWPLLKKGGALLYVTCSILPEENEHQIVDFLQHHLDAHLIAITTIPDGSAKKAGWQILPSTLGGDGFYYAHVEKI